MIFNVEHVTDIAVVTFPIEKIIDEQYIETMGRKLYELVEREGHQKILLDFKGVTYLSSAALGKFICLNKKIQGANGRLILCNIIPSIHETLRITKLNKFFEIQMERQTALQCF